jgi:hypothetical protein
MLGRPTRRANPSGALFAAGATTALRLVSNGIAIYVSSLKIPAERHSSHSIIRHHSGARPVSRARNPYVQSVDRSGNVPLQQYCTARHQSCAQVRCPARLSPFRGKGHRSNRRIFFSASVCATYVQQHQILSWRTLRFGPSFTLWRSGRDCSSRRSDVRDNPVNASH